MSSMSNKILNQLESGTRSEVGFMASTMRGLRISLGNLSKELIITVFLLLVSLVPVIGIASSILIFLLSSYYAGYGNLDYYMEHYFNVSESKKFIKQNRGIALGNGVVFVLILSIPVLGWFLAPALGGIAATLSGHEAMKKSLPV